GVSANYTAVTVSPGEDPPPIEIAFESPQLGSATWRGSSFGDHTGSWTATINKNGTQITGLISMVIDDVGGCSNTSSYCTENAHCPGGTCSKPLQIQTPISETSECGQIRLGSH